MRVKIDLIDTPGFVPAGPSEYIAEKFPATFRIRLQADGSGDHFEFDWGEVRSYARRVKEQEPGGLMCVRSQPTSACPRRSR